MRLECKPGSTNIVADCLSRAPLESVARVLQVEGETTSVEGETVPIALQQVQREQRKDTKLVRIIDFLTRKSLPADPQEAAAILNSAKKGHYMIDAIKDQTCQVIGGHLRQRI